jgi:Protein of unknown function (DUF3347)
MTRILFLLSFNPSAMKYLFTLVAIVVTTFCNAQQPVLAPLLTDYYNIKDALVAGDAAASATKAAELLNAVNAVDMTALTPNDHKAFMAQKEKLAFDARHISESTHIDHQREHFASLSANMATLARQTHLSQQPIYEDYCPMNKSYWLSNDPAIKNPYFGASMPTCGKVTATLKP